MKDRWRRKPRIPGEIVLRMMIAAIAAINLLVLGAPFNTAAAILSDTHTVSGNTLSTAACFPNWMYVWDITITKKTKGSSTDVRVKVTVREDDNTNCVAEGTDSTLGQAGVTVELRDSLGGLVGTDSGSTAGNGAYTTVWFKNLADDVYDAWAVSLSHSTDNWNQDLDVVNPQSFTVP